MATVKFRLRRDTAANWTSANPTLALGEPGLETDTRKVKYGDGVTVWTGLAYSSAGAVGWGDITGKPAFGSLALLNTVNDGNWSGAVLSVANGGTGGGTASGALLDSITGFSSTGMIARTGSGAYAFRTLMGTANEITVTNGSAGSGNPTFSLPSSLTFTSKTITGGTFSGITLSGDTTLPGSGAISSGGSIGINQSSPGTLFHIGGGGAASGLPNGAGGSFTPQASISPTSGVAGWGIMVNDGTNNRRACLFVNQTNGVWGLSMTYSSGPIPFVITVAGQENLRLENGNLTIPNTLSAPSTPTGGGTLYVQGGALKYVGSSGTVTTLAPA